MPSLPDRRGCRRASRTLGVAGALALAVGLSLLGARPGAAAPVPAQAGGERVVSFVVDATLTQPGSSTDRPVLTVHESIDYDFGGQSRHGIFRFVPVRFRCETVGASDLCPAGFDRVTPMSGVQVSSPSGAPTQVKLTTESGSRVIRIGDPKRTVGGRQRYDITYQVTGVMNPNPDGGSELAWNLTGNGWQVPIDAVDATITVPAVPAAVRCVRGVAGSRLACEPAGGGTTKVTVHADQLGVGEGATVYVSLPPGPAVTTPVLDRRWTLDRAFSRTPGAFATTAATGVFGALLVGLFGRRGRDRRFAGSDVDLAMGRAGQAEIPLGLREKLPQVMEFAPPDKLRPGQVGALVDETVDTRDITATIVDLAIRGHLRITEIPGPPGRASVADHQLERTMAPPSGQDLLGYEQLLLDKLFATGSPVMLSALKQKWATSFGAVRSQLYTDLVEHGWYERRPDQQRARATALAVLIGVGVKQSTSDLLVANCDEFIFYDDLVREVRRAAAKRDERKVAPPAKRSPDEGNRRKEELEARKAQAIELVVEMFDALVSERGDSGKIWASLLKDTLKRRRPDFNETYYGFRTFGNLLEEAQNRGMLEFGRDEKSGAYVYRSSGQSSSVPVASSEHAGSDQAAMLPMDEALADNAVDASADAQPEAVAEPAPPSRSDSRRRGRGGRNRSSEQVAQQPAPAEQVAADEAPEPEAIVEPVVEEDAALVALQIDEPVVEEPAQIEPAQIEPGPKRPARAPRESSRKPAAARKTTKASYRDAVAVQPAEAEAEAQPEAEPIEAPAPEPVVQQAMPQTSSDPDADDYADPDDVNGNVAPGHKPAKPAAQPRGRRPAKPRTARAPKGSQGNG